MKDSPPKTAFCIECRQPKEAKDMTTIAAAKGKTRRCCTACQYRINQARKRGL